MKIFSVDISEFIIYFFIAISVGLFLAVRILRFVLPLLLKGNYKRFIQKYFSLIELTIWLIYFAWSVQLFYRTNKLYAALLFIVTLILIFFIAWFAMKDFIAGVVFKTNQRFVVNDEVSIKGHAGKIKRLTHRCVELEAEKGESIIIPYSAIMNDVLIKKHPAERINSYTFNVQVPKSPSLKELITDIKTVILQLPWVSLKREPQIKPIGQQTGTYTIEITVYAIEQDYFYKIEDYIRTHFEKR